MDALNNNVDVLLGNGDGTFQPPQMYLAVPNGCCPLVIAVGDFNGDGAADLVVTSTFNFGTVVVLLNNGNGAFAAQQPSSTGIGPEALVVGDFNHDGFLDVAVANLMSNSVSVLLGNGDGSFQPQQQYNVGMVPDGITAGDFDGNGSLDLAVSNSGDKTVSVLLGKGDGTFQPQKTYAVGNTPFGIAVADFNGDGLLDLAVTNVGDNTISVLLGKGDGTFQPQLAYPAGIEPGRSAVADFNGDGVPDVAASNVLNENTVSILLGGTVTTGQLLNVPVIGLNQAIQSTYTPNLDFYTGSLSNQVVVSGGGQVATMTTVALTMGTNPSSYGQPLTFTATVTANGGGSPTGTVKFTDNGANIAGCAAVPLLPQQNGSTATCQTSSLIVGLHMIVATYSGDQNFTPSESLPFSQVVNKAKPVFSPLMSSKNPSTYGDPVVFTATLTGVNGGLQPTGNVVFTDTYNGTPTILCTSPLLQGANNSTATCSTPPPVLLGGLHSIVASYADDANYGPADPSPAFAQTVNRAATITVVTSSLNPSQFNQPVTFTATVTANGGGGPTGTVNFTADGVVIAGCAAVQLVPQKNGSIAMCQTSTLTVGSHTIIATYSGDQNFTGSMGTLAPNQVVNKADTETVLSAVPPNQSNYLQLVTFTATVTGAFGDSPTGTVTFTDGANPICTAVPLAQQVNASTASCSTAKLTVGGHTITATYNDDANFTGSVGITQYQVIGNVTVTTLSVSPASPVSAGQAVTLTATASSNGLPVNGGTVTFFSGTQSLGTVQMVLSIGAAPVSSGSRDGGRRNRLAPPVLGTATLVTRFAPGTYSLTAQFNGIQFFGPSASAPQQLVVGGTEPTITTLTAQPDGNNYDFTASVFGFGFPAETGTATFNDLTTMTSLGSVAVVGPARSTFQPQQTYPTGQFPAGVAVGDFNGDGIADLAIANYNNVAGTISVLLGVGDGTFRPQQTYATGRESVGVVAVDFNGDGIPDLAIANSGNNNIGVLLGNGDGTFAAQQVFDVGGGPVQLASGDFNGDGIPDLAITNYQVGAGNTVSVLIGDGFGNFQPQKTYPTGLGPYGVAGADFNGDGIADLAVTNESDNTVSVLLGNGDGTFQPQKQPYPVGLGPIGVVTADFNGDGIADLAVTNYNNGAGNTVSVLIGKGDGTFQLQKTYSTGLGPYEIVVTDFNGDGIADLAVTNQSDNTVSVLLGNGDGTFQPPQPPYPVGNAPIFLAAGDFNGDAVPDLAISNFAMGAGNTASILLGGTITNAQLLNVPVFGVGVHDIQTMYAPNNGFYAGGESNVVPVNGRPQGGPTTTLLSSSLNPSEANQAVTFTATVTAPGQLPAGNVTFNNNLGKPTPGCPNPVPVIPMGNGSVATCTTQSLPAGYDGVFATFSDPSGLFGASFGSLLQTVQDFFLLTSAGAITVVQGFNNTNDPFFAQTIILSAQPLLLYGGTVAFSCSVNPILVGGSCTVNLPNSGSLAGGGLNTTLTISAGSTTPIGSYTVTVTAQDNIGLFHSQTLALTVIEYTTGVSMPPGGAGPPTNGTFPGPPGTVVGNLSCPSVTGTGITGSEDFSKIGGVCTFSQNTVTLPGMFTVTISGCTVARLRTSPRILATLWLGLPAVVLLGSSRIRKLPGKKVLQVVATLLLLMALLMGVGCGGGYGQLSPTGMYSVLVQGTGPDGTNYWAVVPVTITPLK